MTLKAAYHSLPVCICKRDIEEALHMLFDRPDLCAILRREIAAEELAMETGDYTCGNSAFIELPFGWGGSPFYFALMADAISEIHSNFRPLRPRWSGMERPIGYSHFDEAIWAEVPIATRQVASAT